MGGAICQSSICFSYACVRPNIGLIYAGIDQKGVSTFLPSPPVNFKLSGSFFDLQVCTERTDRQTDRQAASTEDTRRGRTRQKHGGGFLYEQQSYLDNADTSVYGRAIIDHLYHARLFSSTSTVYTASLCPAHSFAL